MLAAATISSMIWAPVAAGVLAHNLLFRHGEWHLHSPAIVRTHGLLAVVILLFCWKSEGQLLDQTLADAGQILACYCLTLFTSIVAYRIGFHPLRAFPGPPLARVSKFWHVYKCQDMQNHLLMHGLHEKYGNFVRTGPNELAVFHPSVHQAVDGLGSNCKKSDWYDNLWPSLSVVSCRDRKAHDARRRIWDQAFSAKALASYEERVLLYVQQLETYLASTAQEHRIVDASTLFYWFGWDVMGDIIFGRSFQMLETEKWHVAITMLRRAMRVLGIFTPVPWLAHIGFQLLPRVGLMKDWFSMLAFCHRQMDARISVKVEKSDVSEPLIQHAKASGMREIDLRWLHGDAVLAVLAGSDTVAATLVYLFHRLAQDHQRATQVYEEVKQIDTHDAKVLQPLPYLNAMINETLRLHPVLPTGGLRQTPPEGLVVAGTHIPGNVNIIAPRYTTGKLETCYTAASQFIPERWMDRLDLIKDKSTFVPFGTGRFNCVGKQLGLTELRLVTASLVKQFEVQYAPGEDGSAVVDNMRDTFTPSPGALRLRFRKRTFVKSA